MDSIEQIDKKTILITGAGGYIGSTLVGYFLDAGYHIKALDRFFFGEEALAMHANHGSLQIIKDDVRHCLPDVMRDVCAVIDLAGLSNDPSSELDPRLTEEINQKSPPRIAALAKEAGVRRYLFASSCSVYGAGIGIKLTEESPLAPISLYAKAKIEAEKELLKLADDSFAVTILRNATCFGLSPRMRFDLAVNLMTLQAFRDGKIIVLGGGEQWRPFVHVQDVARAYQMVMEANPASIQRQVFNVGSDEQNYRIISLARTIKHQFPGVPVEIAPSDPDRRDYNVSFEKIKRALGFVPAKKIEDGVAEIKYALQHGLQDDMKTITVKYYKYLLDADAVLRKVKHNGTLF